MVHEIESYIKIITNMNKNLTRLFLLVLGPLCFFGVCFWGPSKGITQSQAVALGLLIWMATWWIFEVIPIYATALLPIPIVPFMTDISLNSITHVYADPIIFLFLGGFMLAIGIENVGLHQWFSVKMMRLFGTKPRNQLLAIMCSAAFLSMWVSNTATTLMLLPLVLATATSLRLSPRSQCIFILALAYAASIGGISTLVGTVPNIIFAKYASQLADVAIPFSTWLLIGTPFSIVFLGIVALYFCMLLKEKTDTTLDPERFFKNLPKKFGPRQWVVLGVFGLTVVNWIFKSDMQIGSVTLPGITTLLGFDKPFHDGAIAMIGALLLFIIPTSWNFKDRAIKWTDTVRIQWGVLLLFGGGIALSMTLKETGFIEILGSGFEMLRGVPPLILILLTCLSMTFLTEVTSNTAVTQVTLPILFAGSAFLNINPLMLMIPATISASCAFMLPVATPPNSIVFASGKISVKMMAKMGFILNIIGAFLVTVYAYIHPIINRLGAQ
jgi:solute carrier family 13 (sodium-dependent dicarboxylate transporter), member 2/3/5